MDLLSYTTSVLGVKSILVPQNEGERPQNSFQILLSRDPTLEERHLVERMVKVLGVDQYEVQTQVIPGPGAGLVFGGAALPGAQSVGEKKIVEGRTWWVTHSLESLTLGTPAEIQARKREAWGHLLEIQRWLKEHEQHKKHEENFKET